MSHYFPEVELRIQRLGPRTKKKKIRGPGQQLSFRGQTLLSSTSSSSLFIDAAKQNKKNKNT